MKHDLRRQLETIAESGLRSHPADARHALNLGMRRYRRRVRMAFIAIFAATLLSAGALVTFHHPTPYLKEIVVSAGSTVIQPKSSIQLMVKGTYSDGTTQQLSTGIVWASSHSAVATVDISGKVAGIRPGSTTITAAHEGVQGSINLTVSKAKLTTISVTPKLPSVEAGKQLQLIAEGTYNDRSKAKLASPPVAWKSSNPEVATVDKAGLTSGANPGSTTITATLEGVRATATLKVTAPPTSPQPPGSAPPTQRPPSPPAAPKDPEIRESEYLGRPIDAVVAELTKLGFSPNPMPEPSVVGEGLVTGVTPAGPVPIGTSIKVTYSSGPPDLVPNCIGRPYVECRDELHVLGMRVEGIQTASAVEAGVVVEQQPEAGTPVTPGAVAQITYSAGSITPPPS